MIVGGVMALMAPFVGLVGTVIGMNRSFERLASSGITDPAALSNEIGGTLVATSLGILLFFPGLLIFIASLCWFL